MARGAFVKAQCPADLELLRVARPAPGRSIACPDAYYPEGFFRVRVSLPDPELLYDDRPEIVAESSVAFWDEGTPVQILLAAGIATGACWTLSLTRWGVLRWELRQSPDAPPGVSLESYYSVQALVDLRKPFYAGIALRSGWDGDGTGSARLVVGQTPGPGLHVAGVKEGFAVDGFRALPQRLAAGCGPGAKRPFRGTVEELLVANTELVHIFDNTSGHAGVKSDFPCGSCLSSRYLDKRTLEACPGVEFSSTGSNYWYFLKVTDPAVKRIRFERLGNMTPSFFVSPDRKRWSRVPVVLDGCRQASEREGIVELPKRTGPVFVATAPVYGEVERDRDLAAVRKLGAKVEVVARSTLDLPVHVATLTSRKVPDKSKIGIVLQCGQHSPVEQMGGRLGRPCIEELARLDKDGERAGLLDRLVFYWIPILNIDCARHGTPGNDARRTNPNRCWFANKGPVQEGVERFFLAERDRGVDIRLMLDIHVGMWRNHNIVADLDCTPENPDMATIKLQDPDRQKPAIFAKLLELAGLREIWYNGRDVAEKKRAPEWFQDTFQCPAFTIECSTVSHFDPATRRSRPFTQESYEALGTNLGRFFAWFAGSCRT